MAQETKPNHGAQGTGPGARGNTRTEDLAADIFARLVTSSPNAKQYTTSALAETAFEQARVFWVTADQQKQRE